MLALVRALTYATVFIGLLLVFVPGQILEARGIARPPRIGAVELIGLAVLALGAVLVVSCILTFALIGKGTPAPFDPPRQLVVRGPYKWVRNPMYLGAGLVLLGAAVYYRSLALALYDAVFLLLTHLFVTFYEEPHLRRVFGQRYEDYRQTVHRWIPTWRS